MFCGDSLRMLLLFVKLFALLSLAVQRSHAVLHASVVLAGSSPVKGAVYFNQAGPGLPVTITGHLRNLSPGYHGFHIHEFGNLTGGCASAGAHHNPDRKDHAGPTDPERHIGDLGNVLADNNGNVRLRITDARINLEGQDRNSIIGRALMVHEKKDDLGKGGDAESKKTGNAGGRLACGVIGSSSVPSRNNEDELFSLSLKVFPKHLTK